MLISGKVPPNWWTVAMPMSLASRGLAKIDLLAVHQHRAGRRLVHAREDLDERRLAGAVVAEQAEDFARVDLQRDVVQDVDRAEGLVDVAELEDRGGHHFFPFFGL